MVCSTFSFRTVTWTRKYISGCLMPDRICWLYHLIDVDTQWWLVKQAGNTILYYGTLLSDHIAHDRDIFPCSPAQQLSIPCEPHFRFMILPFGWFSTIHCFHVRLARLKIIIVFILTNSMRVTIHFVKFVFISVWSNDKIVIPCLLTGYGFVPTLNQSYHIRPTASCDTTDSG